MTRWRKTFTGVGRSLLVLTERFRENDGPEQYGWTLYEIDGHGGRTFLECDRDYADFEAAYLAGMNAADRAV